MNLSEDPKKSFCFGELKNKDVNFNYYEDILTGEKIISLRSKNSPNYGQLQIFKEEGEIYGKVLPVRSSFLKDFIQRVKNWKSLKKVASISKINLLNKSGASYQYLEGKAERSTFPELDPQEKDLLFKKENSNQKKDLGVEIILIPKDSLRADEDLRKILGEEVFEGFKYISANKIKGKIKSKIHLNNLNTFLRKTSKRLTPPSTVDVRSAVN